MSSLDAKPEEVDSTLNAIIAEAEILKAKLKKSSDCDEIIPEVTKIESEKSKKPTSLNLNLLESNDDDRRNLHCPMPTPD